LENGWERVTIRQQKSTNLAPRRLAARKKKMPKKQSATQPLPPAAKKTSSQRMPTKKLPVKKTLAGPADGSEPAGAESGRYWLVKSEPDVFSIDDLARAPNRTTTWDGVRNYQARNTLRDLMKLGDRVLFYHSNASPPAIVGVAKIVQEGYPDSTAFDPQSDHFDPKSKPGNPTWYMVDIQFEQKFVQPLTLPMLKADSRLAGMELVRRGSRLSVQPVQADEFEIVLRLAAEQPRAAT
jgi:predicted RNA-binding protein with PUA-like domain